MPRNFVAGLVEGVNFPKDVYSKDKPFVDLERCSDIIIVDRNYFLKNQSLIKAWAQMEEKKTDEELEI